MNYLNFAMESNVSSNHNCCAEPTSRLLSNNNVNNNGWQAPCLCLSAPLLDKWNANYFNSVNMQPSITDQFYYFLFHHHPKMHPGHCCDLNISHFCVIYLFRILCAKALTAEGSLLFRRVTLDACQHPVAGSDAFQSCLFCHSSVVGPASFSTDWSDHILNSWELFKIDTWEFWL